MKQTTLLSMLAAAVAGGAWTAQADTMGAAASLAGNEIRLYASPLAYEVLRDGKTVVPKTPIGLKLDGQCQKDAALVSVTAAQRAGTVATPVYKKDSVDLTANESYADFGDFGIRLVARKDGVAYRFEVKKSATIDCENAALTVPTSATCWFNRTDKKSLGCEETVPETASAADLKTGDKAIYLPFVYSVDGKVVAVTESDVHNYPIWNFGEVEKTEAGTKLGALFAKAPKTTYRGAGWDAKPCATGGRWVKVKDTEDYLVKTTSAATLPWRTFVLADRPSQLCEADIVMALATPAAKGADFSWVKPGKVAWDWWNAFDNLGDPQGCTTKTYERFIDFAAKNGVEYVIFDEGWSAKLNIWEYSPVVDVPHLIKYAEERGVGIILWMAWAQVYGEEDRVAEHFAKLGAKGFKVDFMDRGDADIANFLEKFAAACAKNKMLVDYHGVYRPVGLHRTYPNVINYEGIHGLEQMKWGKVDKDMTMNDVMCFYLRMTAGPMDYTPGAMKNYPIGAYKGNGQFPGSVGTRAHQMALMALYEAPLQMLSDSPTHYEQNMECFSFMAKVPTVWKATKGLCGCPESVAAVARQAKDGSWYVAAIANKTARDYELKTCFLGEGDWKAEIFRDGAESDVKPETYVHETKSVKFGETLKLHLASGGGFIIKFTK